MQRLLLQGFSGVRAIPITRFSIRDSARFRLLEIEATMLDRDITQAAEQFLFGGELTLESYFVELTPVSEMLCYRNKEGREFDLQINDTKLAEAVMARLKELGVRVIKLA